MRELEFLPGWYTKLRAKRQILVAEAWLAILTIAILGLWMIRSGRKVIEQEALLSTRQKQVDQSNSELQKLSELKLVQQRMSKEADLMSRLGPAAPVGKLMESIVEMLPNGMALLDVNVQFRADNSNSASDHFGSERDRELAIQLHGVAPSDIELGTFMWNISKLPNYSAGAKMCSTDVYQRGHVMRDFQLTFEIELSDQSN